MGDPAKILHIFAAGLAKGACSTGFCGKLPLLASVIYLTPEEELKWRKSLFA
jgi:hypothetical protein